MTDVKLFSVSIEREVTMQTEVLVMAESEEDVKLIGATELVLSLSITR